MKVEKEEKDIIWEFFLKVYRKYKSVALVSGYQLCVENSHLLQTKCGKVILEQKILDHCDLMRKTR